MHNLVLLEPPETGELVGVVCGVVVLVALTLVVLVVFGCNVALMVVGSVPLLSCSEVVLTHSSVLLLLSGCTVAVWIGQGSVLLAAASWPVLLVAGGMLPDCAQTCSCSSIAAMHTVAANTAS